MPEENSVIAAGKTLSVVPVLAPATGMLEFFEDLMQLKPNPVALTRFAKRHRKAARLAAPFGQLFDVMGVFIR